MEVQTRKTKELRRTSTEWMGKRTRFNNKMAAGEVDVRQEMWDRMTTLRLLA